MNELSATIRRDDLKPAEIVRLARLVLVMERAEQRLEQALLFEQAELR